MDQYWRFGFLGSEPGFAESHHKHIFLQIYKSGLPAGQKSESCSSGAGGSESKLVSLLLLWTVWVWFNHRPLCRNEEVGFHKSHLKTCSWPELRAGFHYELKCIVSRGVVREQGRATLLSRTRARLLEGLWTRPCIAAKRWRSCTFSGPSLEGGQCCWPCCRFILPRVGLSCGGLLVPSVHTSTRRSDPLQINSAARVPRFQNWFNAVTFAPKTSVCAKILFSKSTALRASFAKGYYYAYNFVLTHISNFSSLSAPRNWTSSRSRTTEGPLTSSGTSIDFIKQYYLMQNQASLKDAENITKKKKRQKIWTSGFK